VVVDAPLVVPEFEAALVQVNRSPIVGAQQAHEVRRRDRVATGIAGLADTGAAPQLNRVVARETATRESLANALANDVGSHSISSLRHRPHRSIRISSEATATNGLSQQTERTGSMSVEGAKRHLSEDRYFSKPKIDTHSRLRHHDWRARHAAAEKLLDLRNPALQQLFVKHLERLTDQPQSAGTPFVATVIPPLDDLDPAAREAAERYHKAAFDYLTQNFAPEQFSCRQRGHLI